MTAGEEARPPVVFSAEDHERLVALAGVAVKRTPQAARLLLEEAHRADVVPASRLPADVVAMHSYVEYRDEATGATRQVQLVYPYEADITQGKISVLSLIGAGLVGLAAGQSIDWPTQDGRDRRLTVLRVGTAPFSGTDMEP